MLVSTKGRYALRVMLELAQSDSTVYMPLPLIAEKQGISEKYLESIISVLSKAGLVDGLRGKGGGYRLNRPAADYSVGQILRLTELTGSRHLFGERGEPLPACRSVYHPPHVGEAGCPHQRLSGQCLSGRPAGPDRRPAHLMPTRTEPRPHHPVRRGRRPRCPVAASSRP